MLNRLVNLIKVKIKSFCFYVDTSRNVSSCYIDQLVEVAPKCKLYKSRIVGNVKIGSYSSIIGPNTHVLSKLNEITIGKYCSIAHNVTIIEYQHKILRPSTFYFHQNIYNGSVFDDLESKGSIEIGHDVWIGTGAVILGGVKIGNGAVIAANSVITKSVEPYSIVGGNPAKHIKYRFDSDLIAKLESMKWWDFSIERIQNMKEFFGSELK
jgi:acetyltransferase-like isoleucine patch superfamily enzyme